MRVGQSLPESACSCQLALPRQQKHLASNPGQRLMGLGAQVVGAVLVAELVNRQPDHILRNNVPELAPLGGLEGGSPFFSASTG